MSKGQIKSGPLIWIDQRLGLIGEFIMQREKVLVEWSKM